jgi:hypothetical protein
MDGERLGPKHTCPVDDEASQHIPPQSKAVQGLPSRLRAKHMFGPSQQVNNNLAICMPIRTNICSVFFEFGEGPDTAPGEMRQRAFAGGI